jgi:hypothetical protein
MPPDAELSRNLGLGVIAGSQRGAGLFEMGFGEGFQPAADTASPSRCETLFAPLRRIGNGFYWDPQISRDCSTARSVASA